MHGPVPKDPDPGPDNLSLSPQRVLTCPVSAVWALESSTHSAGQGYKAGGPLVCLLQALP